MPNDPQWTRIAGYLAPHRRRLAVYLSVLITATALEGVGMSMLIPILQAIGSASDADNVFVRAVTAVFATLGLPYTFRTLIAVFTMIVLAKYLVSAYERHLTRVLSAGVTHTLRRRVFENLMDLPLSHYYGARLGDVVATHVTSTIYAGALVEYGALTASAIGFCVLYLGINALISLPLTALAVALAAIVYVLVLPRFRRGYGHGNEQKALMDDLNTHLFDTLAGIKVVKAFNTERHHIERHDALITRDRHLVVAIVDNRVIASLFMEPLLFVLVVVALVVSVEYLQLPLVSLIAFLFIFAQMLPRVKAIHSNQMLILETLPHLVKVDELITKHDKRYLVSGSLPIRSFEHELAFDRVSFSYPGSSEAALRGVSFTLKAGTTTALVGGSGGGKTTIVDLALRLHDPAEGTIRVDGQDLRHVAVPDWRRLIGIVDQDPYLFHETIESNIRYGRSDATDVMVREASRLAHADDFISALPQGYATIVGTRGLNLSGGQRQRIALARALVRDPEILILDEATSALDSESERFIHDALHELHRRKTILIIAHRFSTIRHADRIVVIDDGRIVEQGTHDELIARASRYREYLTLQYELMD